MDLGRPGASFPHPDDSADGAEHNSNRTENLLGADRCPNYAEQQPKNDAPNDPTNKYINDPTGHCANLPLSQRASAYAQAMRGWLVVAGAMALASCGGSSGADGDGEFAGFDALRSDVREWNRTVAPLVDAYLDPGVTADEYLNVAYPVLDDLEVVLKAMRSRDLSDAPAGVESGMADLVDTYDDKLSAVNQLTTAVQMGDVDAETVAQQTLDRANAASLDAYCGVLRGLAGSDDDDELRDEIRTAGC